MSLSKQLGLGFFFVLLLVFVGTLWINTQNTRHFLEQQLNSHAQDTATSLGLSIVPYIGSEEDLPIIETMVNAIFDRGYYRSIALFDETGKLIFEKSQRDMQTDIPEWFTSKFKITVPQASSEVNDGWNIKGSLKVTSNPGFGYNQLWQNAIHSLLVTLCGLFIAMIFVWYLVKKVISQPINKVIDQADAISQKQFEQIQDIPTTKELYRFVNAINSMSEKLFIMFKKMTNQSEEYRRFAYADFVTGVGNRRAFELAINGLLNDTDEQSEGYLFLVRASSLKTIHTEFGGDAGDKYLKSICQAIKEAAAAEYDHFAIYRVNGGDFALIIENIRESHAKAMAQLLAIYTKRLEKNEHREGAAHVGGSSFSCSDSFKDLMEQADSALMTATNSDSRWQLRSNLTMSHSNHEWRDKLNDIIKYGKADFVAQPIKSKANNVIYSEWFARLTDSQTKELVPMAQLLPASMRLDYAQQLDKLIIQNMFILASQLNEKVGVNISRISLFDKAFIAWFIEKLNVYRSTCPNIVLEIPERALVHDVDSLEELTKTAKSYGMAICVEHFGAQLAGIAHIRQIMPDYLKVDGRFTKSIHTETDNQLFVKSLINIAHGLDIRIIAEKIESQAEQTWLLEHGIDGVQGYFIAPPESIKTPTEE
ncbi:EAL domain-containing protein [Glaciecola sp. SC05]|uniref:bifunctional diguanylate cyclase/phosphodiesterase n=1 Tax=Glaciecola sp. SC05 TaxID=1987355 RepID=UPI0035282A2B